MDTKICKYFKILINVLLIFQDIFFMLQISIQVVLNICSSNFGEISVSNLNEHLYLNDCLYFFIYCT